MFLLAALAGVVLGGGPAIAASPKTGFQSLRVQGRRRRYWLDLPDGDPTGYGLVLVYHGFGDRPEAIRDYSGFRSAQANHRYVFAYVEGTKNAKGERNHQVEYGFQDPRIDDVAVARALVAHLVKKYRLDPKRIFCTGMSNGADMSYYLARQEPPFVAAIAPVAGCMMTVWDRHLLATPRISIMEVHGTADEVTYWDGDPDDREGWGAYLSTPDVIRWWVRRMAIERQETTPFGPFTLNRYTSERDATEVRLYTIPGGKHVWPSVWPEGTLAEEILRFFDKH